MYIYMNIYEYIYVHMYMCIYMYLFIYICIYISTYIFIQIHIFIHIYIYKCICMYIHIERHPVFRRDCRKSVCSGALVALASLPWQTHGRCRDERVSHALTNKILSRVIIKAIIITTAHARLQTDVHWQIQVYLSFFLSLVLKPQLTHRSLEPVSPEIQTANRHFQSYLKWSRLNVNYQNRRTSIFWLMVLSTKIDTACVQMFRAISTTNADVCRWHDSGADKSNTT